MKKQFTIISVILFLFSICFAQQPSDEVLLLIPAEQINKAKPNVINSLRCYQRLPDFFLIGTRYETISQLKDSGIEFQIIDDKPWSENYAVVSNSPLMKDGSLLDQPVKVIFSQDELSIVKGTKEEHEYLRELGYSVVEISQNEIPINILPTYKVPDYKIQMPNPYISQIISNVSDSTITAYIQGLQNFGTRYCLNANRENVFQWLRNSFLSTGLSSVVFDSFQYSGTWQKNVIATIPGTVHPQKEIIVGGHFDSYSSNLSLAPGADDNASGTALAIEMARVLKLVNYQPRLTLRFIGFAAEEVGLKGSADYAAKARSQNRDICVMMNYDMIGYRNQSQPDYDVYMVWYTGSEPFSNLHAAMASTYTPLTTIYTTNYRNASDSWSFYQQGYNTLFTIERDFNPYYHTPNDLLQYLDIPYAREIIKAGLAMLITLDLQPPSVVNLRVADRGNGNSIFAIWDSVYTADFSKYKVYVGTAPGVYTSNYLQTDNYRLISGLTPGTRYYVGVSMVDLTGQESIIIEQSAVPRLIPLPPSNLTYEPFEDGVKLSWRKNTEIDLRGYNVYRAIAKPKTFTRQNSTPLIDTSWVQNPLSPGTYFYFVTAIDSSGYESSPSDTIMLLGPGSKPVFYSPISNINFNNVSIGDTKKDSLEVQNIGTAPLTITNVLSTQSEFVISPLNAVIPQSGSARFYISYIPQSNETNSGLIIFTHNAESSPDTIEVEGRGIYFQFLMNVNRRWNIISLPVIVENNTFSELFPTASSQAFTYTNTIGYEMKTNINYGSGYWVKFDSTHSFPIIGEPLTTDTIDVFEGWNLIGSISYPILPDSIIRMPNDLELSKIYGYNDGYFVTDMIYPGKGYWVKANKSGKLILNFEATKGKSKIEYIKK